MEKMTHPEDEKQSADHDVGGITEAEVEEWFDSEDDLPENDSKTS